MRGFSAGPRPYLYHCFYAVRLVRKLNTLLEPVFLIDPQLYSLERHVLLGDSRHRTRP